MAAQPQQPAAAPRFATGTWTAGRLLMVIAAACFLIAALAIAFSGVASALGPALAWASGGFAAACLSWAMP
jgi:hypothetical protein